jgi:hypothetical protein
LDTDPEKVGVIDLRKLNKNNYERLLRYLHEENPGSFTTHDFIQWANDRYRNNMTVIGVTLMIKSMLGHYIEFENSGRNTVFKVVKRPPVPFSIFREKTLEIEDVEAKNETYLKTMEKLKNEASSQEERRAHVIRINDKLRAKNQKLLLENTKLKNLFRGIERDLGKPKPQDSLSRKRPGSKRSKVLDLLRRKRVVTTEAVVEEFPDLFKGTKKTAKGYAGCILNRLVADGEALRLNVGNPAVYRVMEGFD